VLMSAFSLCPYQPTHTTRRTWRTLFFCNNRREDLLATVFPVPRLPSVPTNRRGSQDSISRVPACLLSSGVFLVGELSRFPSVFSTRATLLLTPSGIAIVSQS
jgi:hypothetical protein